MNAIKETTITFLCVVKIHSQTIIEDAMKLGVKVFSTSHLSCAVCKEKEIHLFHALRSFH